MNNMFKKGSVVLSVALLAACGSDDHDHSEAHHDHGSALLISENDGRLTVLEEGETDALTGSTFSSGANLLLATNGEMAAAISAGALEFIVAHHEEGSSEEAHAEVVTIAGLDSGVSEMVNSKGHFSVLVGGKTQLIPYGSLEDGAVREVEALDFGIAPSEEHPAFLLEETATEKVMLAFNRTDVVVYDVTDASTDATSDTRSCSSLESAVQSSEFTVISCGTDNFSVKLEERVINQGTPEQATEHDIVFATIANVTTATEWKTAAGVFVGLGDDDNFYVVEEVNEALALVDAGQQGFSFAAPAAQCGDSKWGLDSQSADVFALEPGKLTVFDHDGTATEIALTGSTGTCADLQLAAGSKAVYVLDTAANLIFEIDNEESIYHIHDTETFDSTVGVASMVLFHEAGEASHGDDDGHH